MKFLILISLLFSSVSYAQVDVDSLPPIEPPPVKLHDSWNPCCPDYKDPEYPGGWEAMYEELFTNITYPKLAMQSGLEGRVFVEFIIDSTGDMSSVRLLKGIGGGCDEQAIQAFLSLEHCWRPGKDHMGNPMNTRFRVPVNFELE